MSREHNPDRVRGDDLDDMTPQELRQTFLKTIRSKQLTQQSMAHQVDLNPSVVSMWLSASPNPSIRTRTSSKPITTTGRIKEWIRWQRNGCREPLTLPPRRPRANSGAPMAPRPSPSPVSAPSPSFPRMPLPSAAPGAPTNVVCPSKDWEGNPSALVVVPSPAGVQVVRESSNLARKQHGVTSSVRMPPIHKWSRSLPFRLPRRVADPTQRGVRLVGGWASAPTRLADWSDGSSSSSAGGHCHPRLPRPAPSSPAQGPSGRACREAGECVVPVVLDLHAAGVWLQDVLLWDLGDVSAPWGASQPRPEREKKMEWPVGGSSIGGSSYTPEEVAASMCADLDLPVTVFEPLIAASIRTQVAQYVEDLGGLEPSPKRRRVGGEGREQETAQTDETGAFDDEESLHTFLIDIRVGDKVLQDRVELDVADPETESCGAQLVATQTCEDLGLEPHWQPLIVAALREQILTIRAAGSLSETDEKVRVVRLPAVSEETIVREQHEAREFGPVVHHLQADEKRAADFAEVRYFGTPGQRLTFGDTSRHPPRPVPAPSQPLTVTQSHPERPYHFAWVERPAAAHEAETVRAHLHPFRLTQGTQEVHSRGEPLGTSPAALRALHPSGWDAVRAGNAVVLARGDWVQK